MCSSELARVPSPALSLTEDLEYGIVLGLAGVRVHYAGAAQVQGEMTPTAAVAGPQRRRWERGRLQSLRPQTPSALTAALRARPALGPALARPLLGQLATAGSWAGGGERRPAVEMLSRDPGPDVAAEGIRSLRALRARLP